MKVSIVSAYHNRKNLLINTLKSISKSKHTDFEFIIVDDASSEEHRIEDLLDKYPFIKLIRLELENKWYVNPCIPFNIGLKNATGDIVILQNPECFHADDIMSYVINNLEENDYFSFSCFSLDENKTNIFCNNIDVDVSQFIVNKSVTGNSSDGWYNHSIYRNVGYHFTSAIHKKKLDELGGFDERYAKGIGYDDDDFLRRVKKICNFRIVDNPLVLHQYHYNFSNINPETHNKLVEINRNLFFN